MLIDHAKFDLQMLYPPLHEQSFTFSSIILVVANIQQLYWESLFRTIRRVLFWKINSSEDKNNKRIAQIRSWTKTLKNTDEGIRFDKVAGIQGKALY